MLTKNKKILSIFVSTIIIVSVFSVLMVMNTYTPLTVDDFAYYANFATGELLDGFSSVVESMQHHYHYMNGRTIPHTIVQLLALYVEKPIFNVINSIMFVLLGFLIYKLSNSGKRVSAIRLLFIYLLMFTLSPAFGQTVLWFDGSVNYLWGLTVIVLLLYLYNEKFLDTSKYKSVWFVVLSIPIAFLAGGWSENASSVLLMLQVLYMGLYWWIHRTNIPMFYIVDFVVSFASWIFMLTAPANAYRKTRFPAYESTWLMLKDRAQVCFVIMRQYLYVFLLMLLALLMLGVFIHISKNIFTEKIKCEYDKKTLFVAFMFFLGSMVANFVMIAAPYGPRSAFGPVVFMLISLCITASCFKVEKISLICTSVAIILALCMGAVTLGGMNSVKEFGIESQKSEIKIYEQLDSGEANIKIPAVCSSSEYASNTGLELLTHNTGKKFNQCMATYYGAETISSNETVYLEKSVPERAKDLLFKWLFG